MKKISIGEFKRVGKKEETPAKKLANKIIGDFANSDDDVIEIEESDFNSEFKFSDNKQAFKATTLLRNAANKEIDICVKQRGDRIFVGRRSKLEPTYDSIWNR